MFRMPKRLAAFAAASLALVVVLAACGGEDPTAAPPAAATATPTAMAMEATATPTAMAMEATPTPLPPGATAPPATAAPTARPTATPLPVDPGFDAEAYFSGKTISMMVGYSPGGGTDAQARYMSRAWPDFIPGNPRIIVRNLTPDVVQRNFVANSKPDGLTLSVEATAGIFQQSEPSANFDLRDASMVGVTSGKEGLWVIRGTLPYDCIDSAFDQTAPTLTLGTSAPTPADLSSSTGAAYLADIFNLPFEIRNVSAAGSAQQYLMIERGDVNSWFSATLWDQFPITRPGWLPAGFIRPFADTSFPGFDLGHNGQADFHCPNVEVYMDEQQLKEWTAIQGPFVIMSKNIIGPPGIPPEVLQTLRDALAAAMADEEFASSMQSATGIKNSFTPGAQAQQELIDTTQAFLDNKAFIDEVQQKVFDKFVR